MLWLGGFLSLDLTTGTPDALCPPLEEARAAVNARVGEVRGDYHADFALIRADDGRQTLDLTLREGAKEVLRRELPLDAAGCQDAAQTIALVLERYFDAIERPSAAESTPALESVPVSVTRAPPNAAAPSVDKPVATTKSSRPLELGVRAGTLYDHDLGLAAVIGANLYPEAMRLNPSFRFGFAFEVAPFFARQTEQIRGRRIEAFLLQGALSLPLTWSYFTWRASVGPWLQLRVQRADGQTLANEEAGYRAVPGVGGFVQVGWELAPSFGLLAGVSAGPQLRGAASRFVLQGAAGQIAVLVPDAWFGQAQLTLELRL